MPAKVRQDFAAAGGLIAGVDVDYSPGQRVENVIGHAGRQLHRTLTTHYWVGERVYDYDATFRAISPYLHAGISPAQRLRLTGGLR